MEPEKDKEIKNEGNGLLKIGTVLGNRYQIQEVIGIGGMGAVYRARDMHFPNIERFLAIKEMINQAPDPEQRKMAIENFEREAHILATLTHPAIPKIFDFFTDEKSAYLVLEYIAGKDLELMLDENEGILPVNRVIDWAIEICDVLNYLHNHKPEPVIFRDIKPSNIMINQFGHVVLVDFGIAKLFKTGQKGTMIGTEGYSPPEQYRGEATHLADIYALGASLHHLLTGKDPRVETPFTFADRPVGKVNPSVSKELEEIINKALQYNPQNRFQTALEMKNALLKTNKKKTTGATEPYFPPQQEDEIDLSERSIWKFECLDEIRGSVYYHSGMLFFGSYDGVLHAVNAENGDLLWDFNTGSGIVSQPLVYEDVVFIGSEDQSMYGVAIQTGRRVWSFQTEGPIRCSPIVADKKLFFGSDDNYLYAINLASGKLDWKIDTGAEIRSTPCLLDNGILVGNESGEVICFDFKGNIRWQFRAKKAVTSSPLLDQGVAYFASLDSMVYALDSRSGWAIWRFRMGKGSVSSPAKENNRLFIGSADNYIYCIDTGNSKEIWKFKTDHQVSSSPVFYQDQVFSGSIDGNIYCLDAKSGKLKWKYPTNGAITGTPFINDNVLYLGSWDHNLYAINV